MAINDQCECWDPGCPEAHGNERCLRDATVELERLDSEPALSVFMCDGCADDALRSGVFDVVQDVVEVDEEVYDDAEYV